jgi:DNA-binding transcriptional LysR family regulator
VVRKCPRLDVRNYESGATGWPPGRIGLADELLLVVPPAHAWGTRRELLPEHLQRSPLLLREVGSATRQLPRRRSPVWRRSVR